MIKYIIAPLLGGVIGFITNDLAIKMLFHPYKPLYIGKWHVPLTPGLIPSQKERLAKSLGELISSQLLNADTLRREALSDANRARLRGKLERLLRGRERPIRLITGHTGWTDDLDFAFAHRTQLCAPFHKRVPDPDAPYDGYDERDDTEEKARTCPLAKKADLRTHKTR